ncbi:MAG: hypothetical protein HY912_24965 [Desulfomonile tiedjei]|uniref:Uncharacterized protein n=1 Tax=Desulfomonile tiedjei TaxID=2358 RepID=A0A9D6VA59_9BACT|nr:hypothetical protein [Desulfomonile tiedjei]
MKRRVFFALVVVQVLAVSAVFAAGYDIRGQWVGNAKGPIFGAEGTVTIMRQEGENIYGIVEGGNFLGKAKFDIIGKIRGNSIFGEKEGNTFHGYLYVDGSIRGLFKDITGDSYNVFLRRPYSQWGVPQGNGQWGQPQWGQPE